MTFDVTIDWGRANKWFKDNLWPMINDELSRDKTIPTASILRDVDDNFDDLWEEYHDWFAEPKQAKKGGEDFWYRASVFIFYTSSSLFLHTNSSIGLYI